MAFPGARPETIPDLERDWWRDRVRATFRAADATLRFRDFDALFAELFSFYADASAWEAVPEAGTALRDLTAHGIRLAVVSNFDHRLPALLRDLGLADYFEFVLLPAEAGAAKPAATIFEVALARLALPVARVALVGDHAEQDLDAARAVGMRAIDVAELATLRDLLPLIDPAAE